MRVFSGIRASGDKTLGNYSGGFRQYVDAGQARRRRRRSSASSTCTRSRRRSSPRCCASRRSPSSLADRDRARSRPLDGLRAEPRARARGGGMAARRVTAFGELRRMTQFKDKAERAGLRLGRTLHLPGADGGRHPALPHRRRPGRRRPAPARRARRATSRSASTSASARRSSCRAASTRRRARGSRTSRSPSG